MLTRRTLLGALGATVAVPAMARQRLAYDLTPRRVADGIWMVEGATDYFSMENGGAIVNVALIETQAGLVVVDTGSSLRYGEALRQVALQTSGRGVAEVILTHHHPDHFFGNQAFADRPIRALGETRDLIATHGDGFADNMYRLLGDWMRGTEPLGPGAALQAGTFTIGGRAFEALALGGHSEADLALLDVRTGTLITGDLAFYNRAPTTPSADLARWRDSLDILSGIEPSAILPGHGPMDLAGESLAQTRAYLDWLETALTQAANQGLDMVEVMDLPLPEAFAGLGAQPHEYQRSVTHLFPAIESAALHKLD